MKDFTTEDKYLRMPTVIRPISTVLLVTPSPRDHFATVSRAYGLKACSDMNCGKRAPFSNSRQTKLSRAPQLRVRRNAKIDKFSQRFCWKMETDLTPFISFSITTPARPARLEDRMVRKAGRKGMESCCVPDLAI